jgi:hypothetical protein
MVEGDFALGAEEHLPEVAEDGGFARGEAVFGEGEEDFCQDAVDVFGRLERAGGPGEFSSKRGGEEAFLFGVAAAIGGAGRG